MVERLRTLFDIAITGPLAGLIPALVFCVIGLRWSEVVVIDDVPSFRVDNMPYGGVKDSGLGREGIRFAIEAMTEFRLMVSCTPA